MPVHTNPPNATRESQHGFEPDDILMADPNPEPSTEAGLSVGMPRGPLAGPLVAARAQSKSPASNSPSAPASDSVLDPAAAPGAGAGMTEVERNNRLILDVPIYHAIQRCLEPIFGVIDVTRLDAYMTGVLAAYACEGDPVLERMVRQFELAHHRLVVMQTRAADAKTLEEAVGYSQLADRLMAELRRMALAIRDYRTPTSKSTTVVHRVEQLNVADRDQHVSFERADLAGGSSRQMKASENEKASKRNEQPTHESRFTFDPEERQARGRRTPEPAQAAGVDA